MAPTVSDVRTAAAEWTRTASSWLLTSAAVLAGALVAGELFARLAWPVVGSRMFPWVAGRALGLAGYLCMCALVALGLWHRHPLRYRVPVLSPESRLRVHATLAAATVLLIAGHIWVLATDRYARVGWRGAFVPGLSHYRTTPVALGVLAFAALLLTTATAALAGRVTGRHWLTVHRLAVPTFALVWLHGTLAGADTATLRGGYVVTGLVVALLAASRHVFATPT